MDSKIPTSVKIEQPDVYIDYPGEDTELHPNSQICSSLQEQSQMDKKMVFGSIDWKLLKHELSDVLCKDKSHIFIKKVGVASCCSNQEMAGCGDNVESRIPEDTRVLDHHQEVSQVRTENGYTASQHENYSHMSKSVSMIEINTKLFLTNEDCQLHIVETPVQHTQISDKPLVYTSCNPQRLQAGDAPHMSDNYDVPINVETFLHGHKTTDTREKSYKRNVCGANFTEAGTLKCIMIIHRREKPYKCNICGAFLTTVSRLKCHLRTHTGEKPYKCNICGSSFSQVHKLRWHMRIHTEERPYKCDICGASFAQFCNMAFHMRTHTEEKPCKCDFCGASFITICNLKQHMRTHAGEKPYKCDICGASFTIVISLRHHMRTHSGEKPYRCDICGASFTQPGHLNRHMRAHTGEKPYKCDDCGASFAQFDNLKCHMRTHA